MPDDRCSHAGALTPVISYSVICIMMKRILLMFAISLLLTPALTVFGNTEYTAPGENTRSIRILATSDLHCCLTPEYRSLRYRIRP